MEHDDNAAVHAAEVADVADEVATESDEELVDELLIEEISIDGMCGVY